MGHTLTDKIFYFSIAGFVACVFLGSFVDVGVGFSWLFILLGTVLLLHPLFISPSKPARTTVQSDGEGERKPPPTILVSIFLLAAGLGMLRYDLADADKARMGLEQYVGESITLEGIIADERDVREMNTRLILHTHPPPSPPFPRGRREEGVAPTTPPSAPLLGQEGRKEAKILLTVAHEPRFKYGDKVKVEGKLERPKNFEDEKTLREVDYISHLAKDGIYYQMFRPKLTLVAHGEGNPVVEKLFAFKNAFLRNIRELLPEPHASLLGGLIVGAKQSLGKELLDDFRTVGVIHIVVLSGYNITIIARFIEWLFSRLKKNLRLTIAACAMMLFAVMVGASATVIRATVMALLVLLAHGTGRLYAITRALLVAGVIMLLHNPKILVFDISFQLSFLATVGLIYISPIIEPKVKWITERWWLREITVATIATQLFVLPFLLYKTGILSLVSLPVNLLILAAIPLTMLFGFLAGIAAFASTLLALPFAYIAYGFLAYELRVVDWFARLPFAAVALASFPLWLAVLWYAGYGVIIWRMRPQDSPQLLSNSH